MILAAAKFEFSLQQDRYALQTQLMDSSICNHDRIGVVHTQTGIKSKPT